MPASRMVQTPIFSKRKKSRKKQKMRKIEERKKMVKSKNLERRKSKHSKSKKRIFLILVGKIHNFQKCEKIFFEKRKKKKHLISKLYI